ncbi:CPBP family intramembrane glutamic endopeptidase [Virgibacillus ndiopensis]|uniref:CPBP family intramembrane glutamic endopeptidase n=1 Tax=Virgibacillus ndiopensis TaxID=2004408 RepID=UPI000C07BC5A|nr:CPBP family intramembrane glutamic endopeptidase [Virgibacillus ndiopensis]
MKQSELIKHMSDFELKKQLIISQVILLVLSMLLSLFMFDQMSQWFSYFNLDSKEIVYYGIIPGLTIVVLDFLLIYIFPKRYYDDGGINVKLFKNRTVGDICFITLIVALSEELLFRGVIQTSFGYIIASTIFALVHIRYLTKPVLLISVIFVSFYIGYMFEITENLYCTIVSHFIVDFLLGLVIRFQK